ncbi:MAG TPA: adenylate/guanylate cyclase domain-containing protein [Opitutaceae bacterium]
MGRTKLLVAAGRLSLLGLIVVGWCVAHHRNWGEFFENKLIDLRFHYRGEIDAPVKLVYVDIDTDAIQQYKWPWNHNRFAQILQTLFEVGKVKAVGIDLVFSDNALPDFGREELIAGRREFGRAVYKYRKVVLAANYVPGPGTLRYSREFPYIFDGYTDPARNDTPEAPGFPIAGPSHGIVGLIDTYRGETRAAPFFAETATGIFYPLSLQLALLEWGLGQDAVKRFDDRMEIQRPDGTIVTTIPLQRGQLVDVNWFSPWISPRNPRASVANLGDFLTQLESEDPEKQARGRAFFDQFKDAIVLIGPVDLLLQDLGPASFDDQPVPQVGFHGNMLKTIVSGQHLVRLPEWTTYAIIFVLAAGTSLLAVAGGPRSVFSKTIALLTVIAYVIGSFHVFAEMHLVLPIFLPVGAALSTSFSALLIQVIEEQKAKGRIKGMFGTYVSPQLVERMVESGENPQLGGHEQEITAYFSDIQAFSSFSEKLPPARLVELMNEYLTACTDIVQEEGGTLDKYIGDAVVAMFGAPITLPDHALRACIATQRVQRKLAELRTKWQAEGDRWPEIVWHMQSRIGLNSGSAVIGNMGSRTRFNYTMMGDNVNLAARMESGAKAYGVYTMVTETTRQACEQHGADRLVFRYLDKIVVKGRSIPVPIHEVVGLKEHVSDRTRECLEVYAKGIERYLAQDWDGAEARFKQSASLEPNQPGVTPGVETNPSLTLIKRCAHWRANPPGRDWDGVYEMKEK